MARKSKTLRVTHAYIKTTDLYDKFRGFVDFFDPVEFCLEVEAIVKDHQSNAALIQSTADQDEQLKGYKNPKFGHMAGLTESQFEQLEGDKFRVGIVHDIKAKPRRKPKAIAENKRLTTPEKHHRRLIFRSLYDDVNRFVVEPDLNKLLIGLFMSLEQHRDMTTALQDFFTKKKKFIGYPFKDSLIANARVFKHKGNKLSKRVLALMDQVATKLVEAKYPQPLFTPQLEKDAQRIFQEKAEYIQTVVKYIDQRMDVIQAQQKEFAQQQIRDGYAPKKNSILSDVTASQDSSAVASAIGQNIVIRRNSLKTSAA